MTCVCGSERIVEVSGKVSDSCFVRQGDDEHEGYVPYGMGIGGGDYIEFDYCLDCGRIQPDGENWEAVDLKEAEK